MTSKPHPQPGLVVLFGSGETAPSSGKTHEFVAQTLPPSPRIAILETPAGFEPNSDRVAGKIGDYLTRRLQNYSPRVEVLPARKKGTPFSPDDEAIVRPILQADWLFLGPGSPTYAARQLHNSLAFHMLMARHRLGATLMLASSATLAFSAHTMPVYEIYKVGQDLHWQPGLDFFSAFGLSLVVIPHWNNNDGGEELDTSRCYLGRARFGQLRKMLPAGQTIVGLDEHTALVIDYAQEECQVMGAGRVVILHGDERYEYEEGQPFHPERLGKWRPPTAGAGIPPEIWQEALTAQKQLAQTAQKEATPPPEAEALAAKRQTAREQQDWATADRLRNEIAALGWQVQDTADGPQLVRE